MFGFFKRKATQTVTDAEAPVPPPSAAPSSDESTRAALSDAVFDALRTVDDPELGVDIVSLGLIRDVKISADGLHVTMTMTSPACPMGSWLQSQVGEVLERTFPEHRPVQVEVTVDPPWDMEDMSSQARSQLGFSD